MNEKVRPYWYNAKPMTDNSTTVFVNVIVVIEKRNPLIEKAKLVIEKAKLVEEKET